MAAGHGHDHGDPAHAHGHGHAVPPTRGDHGPSEVPPPPAVRSISPARDEYEQPWPGGLLLWPLFWLGVAFLLGWAAQRWTGTVEPATAHGAHATAPR